MYASCSKVLVLRHYERVYIRKAYPHVESQRHGGSNVSRQTIVAFVNTKLFLFHLFINM